MRYELTDIAQHVIQRGNNRQPCFFADEDYHLYLECLADAAKRFACNIHAYVLMTNHVHLLVTPRAANAVAKLMQSVGRKYVRYVNDQYRRTGTLWEGRYKASLVGAGHYVLSCYRYIELNPVRADMVKDPADYRWSSYARNAWGKPDVGIKEHYEYTELGRDAESRLKAYRELFKTMLDAEALDDIRRNLNQCRAFASARFTSEIEATLKRRIQPGKAGRPKKEIPDGRQLKISV